MQTGLGIRPELFNQVLTRKPPLGFLEAHSENYFAPSMARTKLAQLRNDYQLSLHGVGLSLGRADDLDANHLQQLKALVNDFEPLLVSEHLAWSAYGHRHLPDLLPLPLSANAFAIICQHIQQLQETLQRQVLIENPSNYLLFDELQIPEPDFLNALAATTGCGLLVDINNVFVSAQNLQRDAAEYLAALDSRAIHQYHLAGHTVVDQGGDRLLIDTHNQCVTDQVWALYETTLKLHGAHPCLIEWDSDFPEFDVLLEQCNIADTLQQATKHGSALRPEPIHNISSKNHSQLASTQQEFLDCLLHHNPELPSAVTAHRQRIHVYQNNVYAAIGAYLAEVYPATRGVVGEQFFKQMAVTQLTQQPPSAGNIYLYGAQFKAVLDGLEGLENLPYLADLIDYEWALHKAYFADVENLVKVEEYSQDALLTLPVSLNNSVTVLSSNYPIFEIHRQSLPEFSGEVSIDLGQSQDSLLVYKFQQQPQTRILSSADTLLLNNLRLSENILQAIEALGGSVSAEQLAASLAMVIELQLLANNSD